MLISNGSNQAAAESNHKLADAIMHTSGSMQMSQLGQLPSLNQINQLNHQINQINHAYPYGTIGHRTSLSQHNTLNRRPNGSLVGNNLISNYATISRATHGQLMNGGAAGHLLNGDALMNGGGGHMLSTQMNAIGSTRVPVLNTGGGMADMTGMTIGAGSNHHIYGSSPYLQQQPQFVGLEVGLQLEQDECCCCFSNVWRRRCSITRVIAFICGMIVVFLMTLCLASSNWLTAEKYRQGLWEFCVEEGAHMPLPFDLNVEPGCYPGRDVVYIKFAGALCSLGLIFDFLATIMTGFGLCSNNPNKKYTLYRLALYTMIGSLILILTALVIYPAYFASEIESSNRPVWEFGWAFGIGWGACIFLFGAIVLLLCDKETEEIYYKERTIIHSSHNGELKA